MRNVRYILVTHVSCKFWFFVLLVSLIFVSNFLFLLHEACFVVFTILFRYGVPLCFITCMRGTLYSYTFFAIFTISVLSTYYRRNALFALDHCISNGV